MFEGIKVIFQQSVSQGEVVLFMGVLAPIVLVYVGVFLYLILSIVYNACRKRLGESSKMKNVQGRNGYHSDLLIPGDSLDFVKTYPTPKLHRKVNGSAQIALVDVIRGEDLYALKTSLRKTCVTFGQPITDELVSRAQVNADPDKKTLRPVDISFVDTSINSSPYGSLDMEGNDTGSTYFGSSTSAVCVNLPELKHPEAEYSDYFLPVRDNGLVTFYTFRGNSDFCLFEHSTPYSRSAPRTAADLDSL